MKIRQIALVIGVAVISLLIGITMVFKTPFGKGEFEIMEDTKVVNEDGSVTHYIKGENGHTYKITSNTVSVTLMN